MALAATEYHEAICEKQATKCQHQHGHNVIA